MLQILEWLLWWVIWLLAYRPRTVNVRIACWEQKYSGACFSNHFLSSQLARLLWFIMWARHCTVYCLCHKKPQRFSKQCLIVKCKKWYCLSKSMGNLNIKVIFFFYSKKLWTVLIAIQTINNFLLSKQLLLDITIWNCILQSANVHMGKVCKRQVSLHPLPLHPPPGWPQISFVADTLKSSLFLGPSKDNTDFFMV